MSVDFGFACNIASARPADGGPWNLADDNRRFLRALSPAFSTFWIADHLQIYGAPSLECWTMLCTYAAEFPRLQCGTIVLGQSYRNPALLAKMAASFQVLNGGRLILGIGAGWKEDEYKSYGYDYPPPATRIGQLDETIQILKEMWTGQPATFEGRYYAIHDARSDPAPTPIPPLLIGGGGEQLTLKIVAKYADWWNLPYGPVERFRQKLDVLREHCQRLGRDPSTLRLSYLARISVATDPADVTRHPRTYTVAGTPEEVAGELQQFIDLGVTHVMVHFADFPEYRGFDLFQEQVIPQLRRG
jgi:alkanesulfonate monooxygenase SsuD/methylene tetrahydromethanopterin reductase-like flavin-dependent oxidoreductase (luciferase family)